MSYPGPPFARAREDDQSAPHPEEGRRGPWSWVGKLRTGCREPPSSSPADGPPGGRKGPAGAAQRPRPPGETPLRKQAGNGPLALCANISIPETRWPPARARGWGRPSHFSCEFRVRSRSGVSGIRGQALWRTQPRRRKRPQRCKYAFPLPVEAGALNQDAWFSHRPFWTMPGEMTGRSGGSGERGRAFQGAPGERRARRAQEGRQMQRHFSRRYLGSFSGNERGEDKVDVEKK